MSPLGPPAWRRRNLGGDDWPADAGTGNVSAVPHRLAVSESGQCDRGTGFVGLHAGSPVGIREKAAERARPLAYDVAKKLRACEVNHADETHYTINGKPAQVWFHGNEHLAHFYICGTRSGKISRKILGEDYAGGLVMDCYAGYDRHATKIKQRCLEHLKRTAKDWRKVTPEKAVVSRQFFHDVAAWVKRGCRWHRRWKSDSGPEKEREAAWLRSEQARLGNVVLDSKKAQTLQGRIRRYSKEWLTFLDHPGVPPTNNLAEQAVRFLVILRKLTFGSRTRAGRGAPARC